VISSGVDGVGEAVELRPPVEHRVKPRGGIGQASAARSHWAEPATRHQHLSRSVQLCARFAVGQESAGPGR